MDANRISQLLEEACERGLNPRRVCITHQIPPIDQAEVIKAWEHRVRTYDDIADLVAAYNEHPERFGSWYPQPAGGVHTCNVCARTINYAWKNSATSVTVCAERCFVVPRPGSPMLAPDPEWMGVLPSEVPSGE